jgi:hypothetical protein
VDLIAICAFNATDKSSNNCIIFSLILKIVDGATGFCSLPNRPAEVVGLAALANKHPIAFRSGMDGFPGKAYAGRFRLVDSKRPNAKESQYTANKTDLQNNYSCFDDFTLLSIFLTLMNVFQKLKRAAARDLPAQVKTRNTDINNCYYIKNFLFFGLVVSYTRGGI